VIVDLPLIVQVEMTPEAHARYVNSMRNHYEQLPAAELPEEYIDIREGWHEREAIQAESAQALKERRIFRKVIR
jgi:hypothetical protein